MNHQISFIVEQSVKVLKVATLSYNFLVSNDAFIYLFLFFFLYINYFQFDLERLKTNLFRVKR